MSNLKKRTMAGITAIVMAVSLSACDTEDDPNGTNGETDDTGIATTTSTPTDTETTLEDMTTTTEDMTTTTQAP